MNVENPEVVRFTKNKTKDKKTTQKNNQQHRIRVKSDEAPKIQRKRGGKEEEHPWRRKVQTYLRLGCIFLKTTHHAE